MYESDAAASGTREPAAANLRVGALVQGFAGGIEGLFAVVIELRKQDGCGEDRMHASLLHLENQPHA